MSVENIDELIKLFPGISDIPCLSELQKELEGMEGVHTVHIESWRLRNFDYHLVEVVMQSLEFKTFEKIVQKEIDLFDAYKHDKFRFNISAL